MPLLGRALTYVARARVPVFAAEHIAGRRPEPGAVAADTSPLVEPCEPRPFTPGGALAGDVVVKDQVDVAGLQTRVGLPEEVAPAERDATLVARIAAAGGRVIGKAKFPAPDLAGLGTLMPHQMPADSL